jgi:hypothetical protein
MKIVSQIGFLVVASGLFVACGTPEREQGASTQADPTAPTHGICSDQVNVRDSNLAVIGTADRGDRLALLPESKPGTGALAGNTFRRVFFFDAPRGYGWVGAQFICSASNPNPPASGPTRIEVNISENKLYFYRSGALVRSWNVGTARAGKTTPRGNFQVKIKDRCPRYFGADGSQNIPGCSSGNPLGTRALWFIDTMYGLHGTSQPNLIAPGTTPAQRRLSAGCVRNENANIEWLFDQVTVGTPIVIK